MAECLRQRHPERLLVRGRHIGRGRGRRGERERKRDDQEHQACEYRQRGLPAEIVDHRYAERREQELTERSGGGSGAERYAALLERQQLAERRQHQIERAARQSEADQDPGADIKRQRRRRVAHHEETAGVENSADTHDAQDAEPVSDRAGKRLPQPPQQVLSREREAENVAAPGKIPAHRLNEKAEARSRPEAQQTDRATADDNEQWSPPRADAGCRTEVTCGYCHANPRCLVPGLRKD
jgi:hypothetical protein